MCLAEHRGGVVYAKLKFALAVASKVWQVANSAQLSLPVTRARIDSALSGMLLYLGERCEQRQHNMSLGENACPFSLHRFASCVTGSFGRL
eukprot:2445121-Amphidinium_carterae.1